MSNLSADQIHTLQKLPCFSDCQHIVVPNVWMHILIDFGLDCKALTDKCGGGIEVSQAFQDESGALELILRTSPALVDSALMLIARAWERSLSEH